MRNTPQEKLSQVKGFQNPLQHRMIPRLNHNEKTLMMADFIDVPCMNCKEFIPADQIGKLFIVAKYLFLQRRSLPILPAG